MPPPIPTNTTPGYPNTAARNKAGNWGHLLLLCTIFCLRSSGVWAARGSASTGRAGATAPAWRPAATGGARTATPVWRPAAAGGAGATTPIWGPAPLRAAAPSPSATVIAWRSAPAWGAPADAPAPTSPVLVAGCKGVLVLCVLHSDGAPAELPAVGCFQGLDCIINTVKLHKGIVLLDFHTLDAAVVVKVALNVTLPSACRVKVDDEQRGAGLALTLTFRFGLLSPLHLQPPALVSKLQAI
mmetsp:Transcript_23229/g.50990  ORF Transcript_23229/g.50990 Transcript_23229/m.50990 type:complete len:242 (-) Transcript_23229:282-1007(-)